MGNGGKGPPVAFGLIALVLAAAIALGSCSHSRRIVSGADGATSTSAAIPTTSTVAPARTEDAVVSAYRASWAAWYAAVQVANPDAPDIAATTTGNLLAHTRQVLQALQASGERIKAAAGVMPIDSRQPHVVQLQSDTSAVLVDCYLDNTVRYDAAGHAIGETQPTFFSATATMVLEHGAWKVATLQLRKNGCRA